ncbi:MAG: hypothetical protein IKW85_07655 [Muribaculaceae bacterium]|nr:hypothetical protein [Muribaculaceae bacterium]
MKRDKQICETLKQIRLDIARAHGIEYTPRNCNHEGDCAGTCPACYSEVLYLEREISRRRLLNTAAIVGIGLSSLSLTSCHDVVLMGQADTKPNPTELVDSASIDYPNADDSVTELLMNTQTNETD